MCIADPTPGPGTVDEQLAKAYWKDDEELGDDERFLRDFIVNRRWLERDSLQAGSDSESSSDNEKAAEFEQRYNFRFEETGGDKIAGHARTAKVGLLRGPHKVLHDCKWLGFYINGFYKFLSLY